MKRLFVLTVAAAALLFGTATAFAQQKINYRDTAYVKVAPDKEAALMEFFRINGAKLVQEEISSGRFASFALLRIAYFGVPAADYNYLQAVTFDGVPPAPMNPAARDQMYRKATGMSYEEYQQKLQSLRTVVGTVLSRVEATAPGSQLAEGNYLQTVRWKITPNRAADYGNYMQKMVLPLDSHAVKEGRILGWSTSRTVYPAGGDATYDATSSTTFKDLAMALPTVLANPDQAPMNFAKVFPGQNYVAYIDDGRALRRAVRVDLWRVVAALGRGTTTTTSSR